MGTAASSGGIVNAVCGQNYLNRSLNPNDPSECCNARTGTWLPLFTPGTWLAAAGPGNDEAAGDFDGDGSDDLAVGDGNGNIDVYFGEGNGQWSPAVILPTGASSLRPAVSDVNRDGRLDVVVGSGDVSSINSVFVLLNEGNRQFAAPLAFAAPEGCRVDPVRIGDIDGDGWPDVVVGLSRYGVNPCPMGQIGIYRNLADGDGGLATPAFLGGFGDGSSADVRLGDFDGNGRLDIVASDFENTVAFFLNADGGTFASPQLDLGFSSVPFLPFDLLAAHFSGNSDDIVVSSGAAPVIDFLGGSQKPYAELSGVYAVDATFGSPTPIASVIDVNGDGLPDALFANGATLDLVVNQSGGSFEVVPFSIVVNGFGAQMITVGDFNGDGAQDLAVLYDDYAHWEIWLNSCPP